MNKSLSYVNLSLELHVVSTFWLGSDTSGTFSLHLLCPAIIWTWDTSLGKRSYLVQRTDIFSRKFYVNISLMLDNSFLVPSLWKLNHVSLCFTQISTKLPAKLLFPFRESTVWGHPRCFGLRGKFQHNIKVSVKAARVSRLSVSCDYALNNSVIDLCNVIRKYFQPITMMNFIMWWVAI